MDIPIDHPIKLRKIRHSNIYALLVNASMTPKEYCEKWVPKFTGIEPGEYGFKSACTNELAKVTGLSTGAINNWGRDYERAPNLVHRICTLADVLNESSIAWDTFRSQV